MTLTEFLLARIAEDEADARVLGGGRAWAEGQRLRVLVECEAKRQIVRECRGMDEQGPSAAVLADLVLAYLALPYAGHPDYRQEWKP